MWNILLNVMLLIRKRNYPNRGEGIMNKRKKSNWEWYAVKMLFESVVFGEPNPEKVDENYSNEHKIYEERIILVRAQSTEHAYRSAELNAVKYEKEYHNPYDQLVIHKFIDSLDCFHLPDGGIKNGIDVYSRLIKVSADEKTENIIREYYPEYLLDKEKAYRSYYAFTSR